MPLKCKIMTNKYKLNHFNWTRYFSVPFSHLVLGQITIRPSVEKRRLIFGSTWCEIGIRIWRKSVAFLASVSKQS